MITPVNFGAGPPATPTRSNQDELFKRLESVPSRPRTSSPAGESRVEISPEGAAQSRSESQPVNAAAAQAPNPQAPQPAPAQPQSAAAKPVETPHPRPLVANTDLAFAVADANQDGTVTIEEQLYYDSRHLRLTIPLPAEPASPPSAPIRTYLAVDATIASI